jgi:hypothetical protein
LQFQQTAQTRGDKGCQTQKNALCFNGGMVAMKVGNPLDTTQF